MNELTALAERLRVLLPERGPGKRLSAEAKAVCVEAVEVGKRAGIGRSEVARRVGVSVGSLQRWTSGATSGKKAEGSGKLHEVVLRGEARGSGRGLTDRARDGLEVSGVEVVQLVAVVQVLRT